MSVFSVASHSESGVYSERVVPSDQLWIVEVRSFLSSKLDVLDHHPLWLFMAYGHADEQSTVLVY